MFLECDKIQWLVEDDYKINMTLFELKIDYHTNRFRLREKRK